MLTQTQKDFIDAHFHENIAEQDLSLLTQAIANQAFQFSEASLRHALSNDEESAVRRGAHVPAEAPPSSFDQEHGDFQLTRALDVLRAGGVARTPRLPPPTATLAQAAQARSTRLSAAAATTGTPATPATSAPPAAPAAPARPTR